MDNISLYIVIRTPWLVVLMEGQVTFLEYVHMYVTFSDAPIQLSTNLSANNTFQVENSRCLSYTNTLIHIALFTRHTQHAGGFMTIILCDFTLFNPLH